MCCPLVGQRFVFFGWATELTRKRPSEGMLILLFGNMFLLAKHPFDGFEALVVERDLQVRG